MSLTKQSSIKLIFLPRLKDVVFLIVFLGVAILGNQMLNADGDLPRHLATGRLILETGRIPISEPFVYPYLGQPYVPHEWLFGVIFYGIYQLLGMPGLVLGSAFLLATAFMLLYEHLSIKHTLLLPVLLMTLWGAAASSLHWITRPHLFTMLFLVIWLIWMDQLRNGEPLRLWKFLLLMLLWCNLHAEFMMGILVTLAFLAGWVWERRERPVKTNPAIGKRMLIVLLTSLPVTLINPAGYQPWMRVISYIQNDYLMTVINETNPPNLLQPAFWILLVLMILSVILVVMNLRKMRRADLLLLIGVSIITLTSARNVHLYGILAPFCLAGPLVNLKQLPLIARIETNLLKVEAKLKVTLAVVLVILISLFVIVAGQRFDLYKFDGHVFPVQAMAWLKDHPQSGHVFNDFTWGGYMILTGESDQLVFIDSMSDHSGVLTRDYAQATAAGGNWQEIFDRYQIRWAILPVEASLSQSLQQMAAWSVIYSDDLAVIYLNNIE
jgi:hypothetical protein